MNLLTCKVVENSAVLDAVKLSKNIVKTSEESIIFGLRPEDVVLDERGQNTMQIEVIEDLGAYRIAHGKFFGNDFSINVTKESEIALGCHSISWSANAENFFETKNGKRI